MKLKILSALFVFAFLPAQLFSQSEHEYKLLALGGVFSPSDDEIQNIYGQTLFGKIELAASLNPYSRLK